MRALALLALLPSLALAQTTTINGPNGSGGRESAKVTATYGLQTDVTRVGGADTTASGTISTACTTGIGCTGTSYVAISMLGKSTAGMQVTATGTPSGITLQCDISLNGGTTWSEATAGNCQFDNSKTLLKSATITTYAVGDSYQLVMSGGVRNVRVRASALTSGTITVVVSGSDTQDPSELYAGPPGSPLPAGAVLMGGNDATTTNLVTAHIQPLNSAVNELLLVQGATARTASPAYTAGNMGTPSMDVTGSQYVNLGPLGGTVQIATHGGTATGNRLASNPAVGRAAPTAATAGNSAALEVESTTGSAAVHGTAVTTAWGTTAAMVSVNTTMGVKASAGNVYGVACANANASICWLQFYNSNAPTCGTSVTWAVPIPASGTLVMSPTDMALMNHATGIGVCMGTTNTGATACTSANACTIFYK